ncbi:MAG TPA: SRPBCC family protein [Solirubrobacterales bacterium]|nr:SRPBCC family protein [Solirubrobacterales bacterium]
MSRQKTVRAPREEAWNLVSDPYSLTRWWPRVMRVEGVEGAGEGMRWTKVLGTAEGRGVRADFHCTASVEPERFGWEQDVEGTPFERHLRHYAIEVELRDGNDGTVVAISAAQTLRGLSRLGSPMMRRGQGSLLNEALDGLARALSGDG